MGLFDVARGAARVFRKNAFPLRGKIDTSAAAVPAATSAAVSAGESHVPTPLSGIPRDSGELLRTETSSVASDHAKRQRKRDMVSSMVTGGLASGLGWVLGAQPVLRRESDADRQERREKEGTQYDELGRSVIGNEHSPADRHQAVPEFSATAANDNGHEEASNDWNANWDDDHEQHTKRDDLSRTAGHNIDDVEVDDAWEANWGGDEDGAEDEEPKSVEDAQRQPAATVSTTTASHRKEDVEEVGEDWEANWGWE
ncbi:Protein kinase C signaling pathway involved MAPKK protein [Ascosphaera pollenicola]|nr:Protein kinase C signaling pathway involved MAPKK protein [Ascosphaera pollenicola]